MQVQGVKWIQVMVTDTGMKCIRKLNLVFFEPIFQDLDILYISPAANPFTFVLENDFQVKTPWLILVTCCLFKEEKLPSERALGISRTKEISRTKRILLLPTTRALKCLVASDSP